MGSEDTPKVPCFSRPNIQNRRTVILQNIEGPSACLFGTNMKFHQSRTSISAVFAGKQAQSCFCWFLQSPTNNSKSTEQPFRPHHYVPQLTSLHRTVACPPGAHGSGPPPEHPVRRCCSPGQTSSFVWWSPGCEDGAEVVLHPPARMPEALRGLRGPRMLDAEEHPKISKVFFLTSNVQHDAEEDVDISRNLSHPKNWALPIQSFRRPWLPEDRHSPPSGKGFGLQVKGDLYKNDMTTMGSAGVDHHICAVWYG